MSIRINNKIIAGNSSEAKSTSYRYVGEIFQSAIPIDDIKVACLDGHKIYSNEGYGSFIQHLISQSVLYPQLVCTEEVWQEKVTQYGSWGQFVINTQENSVRLPKIAGFIQGLNTLEDLAGLLEAGLPNIEGELVNNSSSSASTGGEWYSSSFTQKGALKTTSFVSNEAITSSSYSGGEYLKTISFDASRSNPIYGKSDTVQPQAIQYPYYIVLATGVVQEINIKDEVHLNNPFFFGMYQYFETNPNNVSWLKSEGQWNNGGVYESFYEWLVNSYNDTESGVSVKLNSDTYTNFDYVLNQNDKTFRLPIEVKQKFYNDISGNIPVAGNGMALGMTDGTANYSITLGGMASSTGRGVGAIKEYGVEVGSAGTFINPSPNNIAGGITTDPTKSGIEAQITQTEVEGLGLYFYVGEVVQNANIINGKKVLDVLPKKIEKEDIYKGITNCLLEVPQRIKLELADGVLTLKAGSKVIVPNGAGVFDEVIITKDLSTEFDNNNQKMVFLNPAKSAINHCNVVNQQFSGSSHTATSSYNFWYDTTNNYVKFSNNNGTTWVSGYSLPICLFTLDSGIDQIFNGMGYMGSTVWVDKGVKCLIPNGRNEDGTLNNIEFTTSTVVISDRSVLNGENRAFLFNYKRNALEDKMYDEDDRIIGVSGEYVYNPRTNNIYNSGGTSSRWVLCGFYTSVNGQITSFQPKQPFKALDYNDFANTPHIIETYQNGTSWYRVWSDGWCEQGSRTASDVVAPQTITFLKSFKDLNYNSFAGIGGTGAQNGNGYPILTLHKTTTSMVIENYNSRTGTNNYYEWEAKGYIK